MDDLLRLPFDQYQRYKLVADLVERVRTGKQPLRILDVGGRTALLRKFLPNDRVELVDVEASDEKDLVLGSGGALPFLDNSFDVVAAFDTLEHVPPEFREDFVRECARVAECHVILAGPYRTPEVDQAEEILVGFMADKLGVKHRYLAEHREYGLPVRAQTEQWLGDAGGRVMSVGHANLDRWLVLMCLELYLDNDPLLRDLAQRFFAFYNRSMYSSDHGDAVYRHAVVASLGDSREPSIEGLFDGPRAPEGATQALLTMGLEVIAFDGEKDAWKPEIKRLEKVIHGLEKNLTGHQKRLADTTEDLSEHKSTLTDERSQRAQEAAEQASIIKSQGEDLAGHQEALAELEPELAAQVKVSKELAQDLKGHRAHLTELEPELAAQVKVSKELAQDLKGHRAQLIELKADIEAHQLAVSNLEASLLESGQVREREAAAGAQVVEELKGEIAARGNLVKELEASLAGNQKQNLHLGELLSEERSLREELTQTLGQQLKDLAADRDSVLETLAGVQQHRTEVLGLLQETQAGAESLEAALQASQAEEARQRAEIERLRQLVGSRLESFKLVFKPERPGV